MSSRKPPPRPDDWDDFDIPAWDDRPATPASRPRSPNRGASGARSSEGARYDDFDVTSYPDERDAPSAPARQAPTRLSSRVPTRTTRPAREPYRDPYSEFDANYPVDPYTADPRGGVPALRDPYDVYAEPTGEAAWGDEAGAYDAPPMRRTSRQRSRAARRPMALPKPAISDRPLTLLVGAALIGLLAMIATVWWGVGGLASPIPWHVNPSGNVDVWASNTALWRIPFGVFMSLVIGLVVGVFLWKRDRFAARFVIASLCLTQIIAWVAVVDQLW